MLSHRLAAVPQAGANTRNESAFISGNPRSRKPNRSAILGLTDNRGTWCTSAGRAAAIRQEFAAARNVLTVQMNGVPDAAPLTIGFPGITSRPGLATTDTLCFGVLAGDVNSDRAVDLADLAAIREQLNDPVDAGKFRCDVNADGAINIFDLIAVRNSLDQSVAPCP